MYLKLTAARAWGLSFSARTHLILYLHSLSLSISLSLSLRLLCSVPDWNKEQCFQLKHIYAASSRNHSSAIVFILCVAYLILSDDGTIINRDLFCRLTSWKGELFSLNISRFNHYFIFIPLSDNKNNKIYKWKQLIVFHSKMSFIENLAASK